MITEEDKAKVLELKLKCENPKFNKEIDLGIEKKKVKVETKYGTVKEFEVTKAVQLSCRDFQLTAFDEDGNKYIVHIRTTIILTDPMLTDILETGWELCSIRLVVRR